MGMFTRKDDHEDEDVLDIEVIGRGDGPDGDDAFDYALIGRDGERMDDALTGTSRDASEDEPADGGQADGDDDPGENAGDDADEDFDEDEPETSDDEADDTDADDDAEDGEDEEVASDDVPLSERSVRAPIAIAAAVVLALVGGVVGFFAGNGGFAQSGAGVTSLEESQLDTPVASYTYNGAKKTVSAREVLTNQYTASASKNDDGTYIVPSAEYTVSYVRNRILADEAAARGITVSDEEMAEYCESTLGTSDFDALAEMYGISVEDTKTIVRDSCATNKLYEQVVADKEVPAAPTQPEEGKESEANSTYGAYIVALLGDEWDAEKGTWARTDGSFYAALGEEQFSADSATYDQAYTAYTVAYNDYLTEANGAWTDFANPLFSHADVTLYGVGV